VEQQIENELTIPEVLPLLPVRDIVVFPYMVVPLFIGRESSIAAVDEALNSKRMIFLSTQKDAMLEDPGEDDIYKTGVVAMILRMLKLPDGRVKILVQGLKRGVIEEYIQKEPYYKAKIKSIDEEEIPSNDLKVEALIRYVKDQLAKAVNLGKPMLPDLLAVIDTINVPGKLADIIAANLGLKSNEAQEILEKLDYVERLNRVSQFLTREITILEVQNKILNDAKGEIDKSQREYFLKEQLKAIRKELGDEDDLSKEVEEFEEKLKKLKMPKEVKEEATKQLKRLSRMHSDSAEATVVRTYLEWIVELPWGKITKDNLDIENAKKVLEEDHFGLEEVKDRILDFLAVRKLNSKMKSPIICFVGPPGVGKTSLGKSIARAMGRKFVRISLGGLRDEAEIRGHRRTYIGALPGKIIQGLRNAGSSNPVFMLDEIDKLGSDFRGDPSSALLEVLDPEQNNAFVDHYLGVPYDLSKIMFITTANYLDPIPPALKDRMEIIHIPGYIEEEKIQIAKKYLLPRQIVENGLKENQVIINDKILSFIISGYTRESGLRNLERLIGTICRKVARKVATGEDKAFKISKNSVLKYLGPIKYYEEDELKENEVGIVTGLAWTPYGGDVLFIESAKYKGKGNLVLTGQLGDVMKESARAALTFVRSIAEKYNIDPKLFEEHDIHLHVPAGAIPKDGPSAGITMATAIFSLFSGKKVKKDVAMTGEITITGKVLPIGGLKEKLLAAKRMGIKTVIIPKKNENDLIKLSKDLKKGINVIPVERFEEVLMIAIVEL
jgi:ATP-dependent Lon protease